MKQLALILVLGCLLFGTGCQDSYTFSEGPQVCGTCDGAKKFPCQDCYYGRHDCPNCTPKGTLGCNVCEFTGKVDCEQCGGNDRKACPTCNGQGWVE
jgi:hypothetical protein